MTSYPSLNTPLPFRATPHPLSAVRTPRIVIVILFALLGTALTSPILAQPATDSVPGFEAVAGHAIGERITVHHQMVSYLHAVGEASPRVKIVDQGKSWEGRELLLAIVTSEANHARLDAIHGAARELGDPRGMTPERLAEMLESQPAIVWLGGSIHGFELSGSEAMLALIEQLTRRDDELVHQILDQVVVLIDPMINPDGRDAFAHFNHRRIARRPNARRDDWANRVERWDALAFRTGHYFFDTNRDWFTHSQRETMARVPTLVSWRPQVIVDAHEMGPDIEFYFDPPADPYAPHFPDFSKRWFEIFGQAYASAFDGAGFEYTQREIFNYFFPGYTTSYGSYQGAVGMLYEQGSSRGLALERPDGSVRQLVDATAQQLTAAFTAVQTAARERRRLLEEYHQARVEALEEGGQGISHYLITAEGDPTRATELVRLLQRNGIEVRRLEEAATLDHLRDRWGRPAKAREFATGTWIVEAAQPQSPLLRTLLAPDLGVPEDFLAEARKRLDQGENPGFYDITAWSLPLLFDVVAYGAEKVGDLSSSLLTESVDYEPSTAEDDPAYAYLVDGRSAASMAVLQKILREGFRASVTLGPTRVAGRDVPGGSVVVRRGQNPPRVVDRLRSLAELHGVGLEAVATGRGDRGHTTLGSTEVLPARPVEVALLAQDGIHAYSFGWLWYTLEEMYHVPTTVLRAGDLAQTPLDDFDTLVIPDLLDRGLLARRVGEAGIERLKRWVADGGTLVAVAQGVDFVRLDLGQGALLSDFDPPSESPDEAATSVQSRDRGAEAETPRPIAVPGALVDVGLDAQAWLRAGYQGESLPFLLVSDRVYRAPAGHPDPRKRVVAQVGEEDELVSSGHLWAENRERLPGSVLVYEEIIGQGRVVFFTEDIGYRAQFRGAHRLLLNAVLLGPSAR